MGGRGMALTTHGIRARALQGETVRLSNAQLTSVVLTATARPLTAPHGSARSSREFLRHRLDRRADDVPGMSEAPAFLLPYRYRYTAVSIRIRSSDFHSQLDCVCFQPEGFHSQWQLLNHNSCKIPQRLSRQATCCASSKAAEDRWMTTHRASLRGLDCVSRSS